MQSNRTGAQSAISRRALLVAGAAGTASAALAAQAGAVPPKRVAEGPMLALRPPMGWNSWNSFATTINETQALETAGIMARKLLPFGYDIFTIDIQWYEPSASSYDYSATPVPTMDGYGRLLPAPNRFPSSAGGKGFKPLADRIHDLGLKFGIHLMRGIPRLAVERNLPIEGTPYRAADIADRNNPCHWNPDMWGVDMTKPGAQAYYDSVFRLYASWGLDFIKIDDMSYPYDTRAAEIEAVHAAIARCGRPIILSLSPGETPLLQGDHVSRHAQMWRIADDLWDEWPMLEAQFARLENWTPYRRPGAWPDADMLPLGRLALGERDTRFTPDEQRTLMTLWAIARSPLIMGGDLRHLDAPTLALLTNREVLAVNQASTDNRPHDVQWGLRVWSARAQGSDDRYVALFHPGDKLNPKREPREVAIGLDQLGLVGPVRVRDLWSGRDLAVATGKISATLPVHGAALYRLTV